MNLRDEQIELAIDELYIVAFGNMQLVEDCIYEEHAQRGVVTIPNVISRIERALASVH